MFYVSGHTGVIHDLDTNQQQLLQGHCNPITAACVSKDAKWIVTSDTGLDSMVIVWEAASGTPVKTIFQSQMDALTGFANSGVVALGLSHGARFLATLSSTSPQMLALWDWAALPGPDEVGADDAVPFAPLVFAHVPTTDLQLSVAFNEYVKGHEGTSLVTNGDSRVVFWHWSPDERVSTTAGEDGGDDGDSGGGLVSQHKLHFYAPPIVASEFKHAMGAFTLSIFLPHGEQALTATVDGDLPRDSVEQLVSIR